MSVGRTGPDRDADDEDLTPFEGWTFATDSHGDIKMTDAHRPAISHDAHAVRQVLLTAIGTTQGEDDLDPDFGLDVFTATNSVSHLQRELARTLLYDDKEHERVENVENIEVWTDGSRNAEVRITAALDSGDLEVFHFDVGGVLR